MLPPVDPQVLAANPNFDVLYRDLCTNKLNEDGTTKADAKQQKERDAFNEELRRARIHAAKKNLIKTYLATIPYRHADLPDEVRELVTVITAILQADIGDEDAELLADDVEKFKSNIISPSRAISTSIAEDLSTLTQIAFHNTKVDERQLPRYIEKVKQENITVSSQLTSVRLSLAQAAVDVHTMHREVIEAGIRILEQTLHGSVSRSTRAKADYLATVAEGMSKKLGLQLKQLTNAAYAPEMQDALAARSEQLDREGLTLKRKIREAEDRLAEYRQSKALAGLAKDYAEVLRETERVQKDITQLEQERLRK